MSVQGGVLADERGTSERGVRHDESIEGIARPAELLSLVHHRRKRRITDREPQGSSERVHNRRGGLADATELEQVLQLETYDGRDPQVLRSGNRVGRAFRQPLRPLPYSQATTRIELDHGRHSLDQSRCTTP